MQKIVSLTTEKKDRRREEFKGGVDALSELQRKGRVVALGYTVIHEADDGGINFTTYHNYCSNNLSRLTAGVAVLNKHIMENWK